MRVTVSRTVIGRIRVTLADTAEQAWQEVRSNRGDDAEAERVAEDLSARAAELLDVAHRGDHRGRTLGDLAAKGGEPSPAGQAVDEPCAKRSLEFSHLHRECRLGHAERRRGTTEMAVGGQCIEVTELAKRKHRDKKV